MPALNPTEISFGGDPDAPLRVAKTQVVRCAPRSCGTIAPLSHFCSAGRLRRGFFSFFIVLLEPPDAVFALHDSRVQISWRKHAIPSRLALLTGVESAGRRHRRRKANFATPRASARGFCILSCAKPHRKFFRRGPRFMPHKTYVLRGPRFYTPQNMRFAGTPDITPPKILSVGTPIYARPKMLSVGTPV